MRKRNKAITIRMSEAEFAELQDRISESGLTQQAFVIDAVRGATITPSDEIAAIREISRTFASLERQLRGLGTNVNQMAHIANSGGDLPTAENLERLSDQLDTYRKESESVWQSIRSLTAKHRPTARCGT